MARLKLFLPLLVFLGLAALFWTSLGRDTSQIPSALIDKPVPAFTLASLKDQPLTNADLPKEPFLLNVWASWCYACRIEHPMISKLAKEYGVNVVGLNYKDAGDDARKWLGQFGDPYLYSIADLDGRLGLDLGVVGAPETFIVDGGGVVRYKHTGVVDQKVYDERLKPVLQQLRREAP